VAEGRPRKNIGPRLEDDIRVYREVWGGAAIGGAVPASMVFPSFDAVRARWKDAGRTGAPRLVALA
jgi:hypothetical protein